MGGNTNFNIRGNTKFDVGGNSSFKNSNGGKCYLDGNFKFILMAI